MRVLKKCLKNVLATGNVWLWLPPSITYASSLSFRRLLKTFLFQATTASITLFTVSWSWSARTQHHVNRGVTELNWTELLWSKTDGDTVVSVTVSMHKFAYIIFLWIVNSCSVIFAEFGGLRILCRRFVMDNNNLNVCSVYVCYFSLLL